MIFYEGHKVYMNGEYPAIFLNGQNVHIHRLQWLKYHGEIPKGCVIHHKDENKLNWSIENLEMLSRKDHIVQHKNIVHRKGVPVIAMKNGVVLKFESIEICADACGTYPVLVRRCLQGTQKQSKGWTFERV
jgi:hypothetical protein